MKKHNKIIIFYLRAFIFNAIIIVVEVFMGHIYDYYYVGDRSLLDGEVGRSQPTLISFSKKRNDEGELVPPHIHSYTELFYFESGTGTLEYDGGTIAIKPHDLVLINANALHRQYSDDDSLLTYYGFAIDDISLPLKPKNCISDQPFHIFSGFICTKAYKKGPFNNSNNFCYP